MAKRSNFNRLPRVLELEPYAQLLKGFTTKAPSLPSTPLPAVLVACLSARLCRVPLTNIVSAHGQRHHQCQWQFLRQPALPCPVLPTPLPLSTLLSDITQLRLRLQVLLTLFVLTNFCTRLFSQPPVACTTWQSISIISHKNGMLHIASEWSADPKREGGKAEKSGMCATVH